MFIKLIKKFFIKKCNHDINYNQSFFIYKDTPHVRFMCLDCYYTDFGPVITEDDISNFEKFVRVRNGKKKVYEKEMLCHF